LSSVTITSKISGKEGAWGTPRNYVKKLKKMPYWNISHETLPEPQYIMCVVSVRGWELSCNKIISNNG